MSSEVWELVWNLMKMFDPQLRAMKKTSKFGVFYQNMITCDQ